MGVFLVLPKNVFVESNLIMTSQQLQDRWDQATRMYPVQTFERAGTTWRYRASGDGEHTLIVLPGALGARVRISF